MTLKKYLENQIRDWFPKEPNMPSNKVKAAEAPTKAFKVLWYIVVFAILALAVVAVIIFYVPFLADSLVNRTIVLVILVIYALFAVPMVTVALYRAYGRDYYKRHRFRIMLRSGLLTALTVMILLSVILGSPKPYLPYLWIPVIILGVVGAFIGDNTWKKLQKHDLHGDSK